MKNMAKYILETARENDGFAMTVFLNRRDFDAHDNQIKIDKFEV